eukprot:542437_1
MIIRHVRKLPALLRSRSPLVLLQKSTKPVDHEEELIQPSQSSFLKAPEKSTKKSPVFSESLYVRPDVSLPQFVQQVGDLSLIKNNFSEGPFFVVLQSSESGLNSGLLQYLNRHGHVARIYMHSADGQHHWVVGYDQLASACQAACDRELSGKGVLVKLFAEQTSTQPINGKHPPKDLPEIEFSAWTPKPPGFVFGPHYIVLHQTQPCPEQLQWLSEFGSISRIVASP